MVVTVAELLTVQVVVINGMMLGYYSVRLSDLQLDWV
jgi:hypothetical protein